jgi:hypothetical protein
LLVSSAADDPAACTRFAVTVAPGAVAPGVVAETVGDVVAGCVGTARRDAVALAVADVLAAAAVHAPQVPVRIRVRQRDDRTIVELLGRGCDDLVEGTGALTAARQWCDEVTDEVTELGHVVRLVYRTT